MEQVSNVRYQLRELQNQQIKEQEEVMRLEERLLFLRKEIEMRENEIIKIIFYLSTR